MFSINIVDGLLIISFIVYHVLFTLLHLGQIPTFYLRRYGQNCPYCRKIEEIYKKKNHVAR
jgi:hypothetical protein